MNEQQLEKALKQLDDALTSLNLLFLDPQGIRIGIAEWDVRVSKIDTGKDMHQFKYACVKQANYGYNGRNYKA